MSYLVDTNVISELRKGRRCNQHVTAWFAEVPDNEIYLSVLVIGEIRCGIERLRRRDQPSADAIESWLTKVVNRHGDRILGVNREVAEEWGRMNSARPLSTVDSLLAATAKVHKLTLATRNTEDIATTGAKHFNPFKGAP